MSAITENAMPVDMKHNCIFLIDDELVNLKLLQRTLSTEGYNNLVSIQDPREFLQQYQQNKPALILLDINMPHIDGFGILEQINALNDNTAPPVIVLTAQFGQEFLIKALQNGARDYITKPFERIELLMRVKNHLAAHLDHVAAHNQKAHLEQLVNQRTIELRQTRLQVVQRLGMAAEYRDEETGNHILRMSHSARMLAEAVGWDEYRCDLILHASPMHDIGKIGIPDNILLKPGKFEPDEWEIMKTHAAIGAKLLGGDDSDLMKMAQEIALCHHEKWDGNGYPDSLAGNAIPESARIAAICDVFDALTSVRPYKKAWSVEDAVKLLEENKDKHFEGRLVTAFLQNLDKVLAIRHQFSDEDCVIT